MRWRPLLSLGVIAALGVAVWAALSAGRDEPSPTTSTTAPVPTSSTTSMTTTTTVPTTSTSAPSPTAAATDPTTNPEARLEEVRLILEDLYYRWFDAIYRNDEAAVREVVATEQGLENFERAVAESGTNRTPTREEILVDDVEILEDNPDCLVTAISLDLTDWRGPQATVSVVDVLWPHDGGWRFAASWNSKGDLWAEDCTAIRSDELP